MTSKTALVLATTAAIALANFDMRPAAAAPEGGPAIVKQNAGVDELSSQRKRRRSRGVNPAVPLAAFGAIIGTIGAIAAANRQREVYYGGGPYYGGGAYYYAEPQYYPAPQYHVAPQPHVYHRRHVAPVPRHHGGDFRGGHAAPSRPSPSDYTSGEGRL